MCVACQEIGEGKLWYKNPRNYARNLYKRKPSGAKYDAHVTMDKDAGLDYSSNALIKEVVTAKGENEKDYLAKLDKYNREFNDRMFNCILPLKDAQEVMDVAAPIALMSCVCRRSNIGRDERNEDEYSCLGLGMGMYKWERWPEVYKGGVKFVAPDEAKEWLEKWDKRGMVHMIMTFGRGFIGGICNCDYPHCYVIRRNLDYDSRQIIKGHYVAKVDYQKCTGCGKCLSRCQFGCITRMVATGKPSIDMMDCAGCGLCQTACRENAISLPPRESLPPLKDNWRIAGNRTFRKAPTIKIDREKCRAPFECKKCLQVCPAAVFWAEPRRQGPGKTGWHMFRESSGEDYELSPLYKDMCSMCLDCVRACPAGAISITAPEEAGR